MTSTIPDTDILEGLDFDHTPPCEVGPDRCAGHSRPATHRATFTVCGCQLLICDACANHAASLMNEVGIWFCNVCVHSGRRLIGVFGRRRDMVRIEPLP